MQVSTLNPAQLQLIETFAGITSQQELDELTQLIRGYFARKLDAEMSRLADEGVLGQAQLDDLRQQHLRTPYECDSRASVLSHHPWQPEGGV